MSARTSKDDVRAIAHLERLVAEVVGLREDVRNGLEHPRVSSDCRDAVEPNAAHDPLQLLTVAEVAGLLRIDQRTLRSLRHERSFPRPVQVGRSLRWRRSAVERYLRGAEA